MYYIARTNEIDTTEIMTILEEAQAKAWELGKRKIQLHIPAMCLPDVRVALRTSPKNWLWTDLVPSPTTNAQERAWMKGRCGMCGMRCEDAICDPCEHGYEREREADLILDENAKRTELAKIALALDKRQRLSGYKYLITHRDFLKESVS